MSSPNATDENSPKTELVEESKEEHQPPNDEISFIQQVEIALTKAKSENKILMVLCETEQNMEHISIWNHPRVVESVRNHAICLLIHNETLAFKQFTALYPVIAFPTMYCINPQNGQVLQCKYKDQITLDTVCGSITTSVDLILKQAEEAKKRSALQIREITEQQTASNNTNNPIISIQEMDERSHDSLISSATPPNEPKKPKKPSSALTKLQQIRAKAQSQKTKSQTTATTQPVPPTNTKRSNVVKEQTAKPKTKPKAKPKPKASQSNNYNFDEYNEDKLDAIEYMEVTRRNKLRKRKKKVDAKFKIPPKKPAKKAMKPVKKTLKSDVVVSTPVSSVKKGTQVVKGTKARVAFRINNEMDLEKYFNADDTLMAVMTFIMNETGLNDFVFVSQYPPINIDSIYLDRKMSAQMNDEKSNESMYDEIQNTLQKTLYELNMVPSCRVFVQPKFKGHPRRNTGDANIVVRFGYFVMDLIKIIVEYGYSGLMFVLCFLWEIINVPLSMMGITSKQQANVRSNNKGTSVKRSINNNQRTSKLKPLKKNTRLTGKKASMARLRHLEKDEDKNRLNNGNSTMFGGDGGNQ